VGGDFLVMADELFTYLKKEYSRMDEDYQKRRKAWEGFHKQYRGIIEETTEGTNKKSRLFINRTKVAVLGGLANIIDVLFPGTDTDFFDVVGRTDQDQKSSGLVKKVTQWIVGLGEFHSESMRYVLQAAIYGSAIGKITKKKVIDVMVDKHPILNRWVLKPLGVKNLLRKKEITYPIFETVDIFDIWVDPMATTIENASGLFHKSRRTFGYLKSMEKSGDKGVYTNLDEVEKMIENKTKRVDDKRRSSIGLSLAERYPTEIDIYEYWGIVPADVARGAGLTIDSEETEVECIVTLADMLQIIRVERNTYPAQQRMFVKDVWEDTGDKSFYGRGICENVKGPQMALNATVNMRLDNKAWAIAAPLVINESMVEDDVDLTPKPGWVIRGDGRPQDIAQFIPVPNVSAGSHVEAQEFERHIEEESGINKTLSGPPSFGSNRTFGGISMAFSAASRPIRLIAREFENNLISKTLRKLYTLFLIDMDEEITVRITDDPSAPQFLQVDPFDMTMDIDFIPSGTFALASREAVVQNLTQFAQAVSQLPGVAERLNWEYLVRKFYEGLGFRDFDKVWMEQGGQNAPAGLREILGGQGGGAGQGGPERASEEIMGQLGAFGGMEGLEEITGA
jgi:hypothetical protein